MKTVRIRELCVFNWPNTATPPQRNKKNPPKKKRTASRLFGNWSIKWENCCVDCKTFWGDSIMNFLYFIERNGCLHKMVEEHHKIFRIHHECRYKKIDKYMTFFCFYQITLYTDYGQFKHLHGTISRD